MAGQNADRQSLLQFYVEFAKFAGVAAAPASPAEVDSWMSHVDAKSSPTQLRKFLQTSATQFGEPVVRALAQRFQPKHAGDKLFVLIAEYLYNFAPKWFQEQQTVSMADVADVLEPVLGMADEIPGWAPRLEELVQELVAYEHLHDLARHGIFERGRELKARVSAGGLTTMGMFAFARFNYLLRKTFNTLWQSDLWWIEQALLELEGRAEFFVDCTEVGMSPIEPTNELAGMVREWKQPSFSDYAEDETYKRVQTIREILNRALIPESV